MGRPYCLSPKLPPPSVVAQFIEPSGLDKIKPLQGLGEGGRYGVTGFPACGLPGILSQLLLMSYHYAYQPGEQKGDGHEPARSPAGVQERGSLPTGAGRRGPDG